VGQSKFRCNLAVRGSSENVYQLGILVDTDGHYANSNLLDRYLMQPSILRAFGWRFAFVLTKDWYHNPDDVLVRLEKALQGQEATEDFPFKEEETPEPLAPIGKESTTSKLSIPPSISALPVTKPAVASPPLVQAPSSTSGTVRHFELIGGSSRKFWEISVSGKSFTVRFGRMGTAGQSQTKNFADDTSAKSEADKLVAEKVKKGYLEKSA
jgi:predicted DNA-binding WGR domain protein